MKRGKLVPSKEGVMLHADSPPLLEHLEQHVKKHYADQVSNTLHCIKRLRPDSIVGWLPKDVINYIGQVGARDCPRYPPDEAVRVIYRLEITTGNIVPNITGFDKKKRIPGYRRFQISFLCWPNTDNYGMIFDEMTRYINMLISDFDLFDHAYGMMYHSMADEQPHAKFGDSTTWEVFHHCNERCSWYS